MRAIAIGMAGVLVAVQLGACRADPSAPVPARLVDPDQTVRAELRAAVEAALHGASVLIADDALTTDSLLVITHRPLRDDHGRPVMGRIVESPVRFQLVREGSGCVLVNLDSGARAPLEHAVCSPLP
ncbi:MAG: hypothetical protein KF911_12995 [Pseudomonadales bacterium]|nr:hypothetical protein [Pseudomonadales bacterium]